MANDYKDFFVKNKSQKTTPSNVARSRQMALIRSTGNQSTELRLIQILKARGISGWRRNFPLLGKPDFVFPKERFVIFVDGCFWHGHLTRCRLPATNRAYWVAKIARNKKRDKHVSQQLRKSGWRVLRLWEHELKRSMANLTERRILQHLQGIRDKSRNAVV